MCCCRQSPPCSIMLVDLQMFSWSGCTAYNEKQSRRFIYIHSEFNFKLIENVKFGAATIIFIINKSADSFLFNYLINCLVYTLSENTLITILKCFFFCLSSRKNQRHSVYHHRRKNSKNSLFRSWNQLLTNNFTLLQWQIDYQLIFCDWLIDSLSNCFSLNPIN